MSEYNSFKPFWIKDNTPEQKFSCPYLVQEKDKHFFGESPCSYCAHPECPKHQKIIC